MKKFISLLLCIIFAFSFASCSNDNSQQETTAQGSVYDLDLSRLSSTMVYSEVYNMVTSPESYVGKTIKMKGTFVTDANIETGDIYFACIIQDATACCQQGIQFVPTKEYTYPMDFPHINEEIEVVGTFEYFVDENNIQVIQLVNCDIEKV